MPLPRFLGGRACATAAGRIPVVATVNAGHALPAVRLAQRAAALGAGGIMALPPYVVHPDAAGCYDFYETLAAATSLPLIVQNYIAPVGTPMSAAVRTTIPVIKRTMFRLTSLRDK